MHEIKQGIKDLKNEYGNKYNAKSAVYVTAAFQAYYSISYYIKKYNQIINCNNNEQQQISILL